MKSVLQVTVIRLPSGQYKAVIASDDPALAPQARTAMDENLLAIEIAHALPEFLRLPCPSIYQPAAPKPQIIFIG